MSCQDFVCEQGAIALESHAFLDEFIGLVNRMVGFRDGPHLRSKIAALLAELEPIERHEWRLRLAGGCVTVPAFQEVVRRIAVHETFFYRDAPQLTLLREQVLPEITHRKRAQHDFQYNIWSAGCSTGEEVYTLAFILLEHLLEMGEAHEVSPGVIVPLPEWRLNILGTDMSNNAIRHAQAGYYADFGLSAFRELPPHLQRFFTPVSGHPGFESPGQVHQIRPEIRRQVRFEVRNLQDAMPPIAGCDIVSCRNVMIYFDDVGKERAGCQLDRALRPGGYLTLGSTDAPPDAGYRLITSRTSPVLQKGRGA